MSIIIIATCGLWDIDYNSDNWETDFMTILVTWQLRVTLDSIHNSCNVFFSFEKPILLLFWILNFFSSPVSWCPVFWCPYPDPCVSSCNTPSAFFTTTPRYVRVFCTKLALHQTLGICFGFIDQSRKVICKVMRKPF